MRSAAFVLVLLAFTGCATAPGPDFTGRWRTTWKAGNATMTLVQTGTQVKGDYSHDGGSVFGTVTGRKAKGEWVEHDSGGTFEVELAPDGQGIVGTYATTRGGTQSGYWTAIRDN